MDQKPPPYTPSAHPPAYSADPYVARIIQPPRGNSSSFYPMIGYQHPAGGSHMHGIPQPNITVVTEVLWGPYPMQVTCPHCTAIVMTETAASPGLLTFLLSGAIAFLGCWLGCCLIPCCIPECQDIEHRCPSCKTHLGLFRRM